MRFSKDYLELGKIVTQKLRVENFESFLKFKNFAKSMTSSEYYNLPRNPHLDKEIQKLNDERFDFYYSLNKTQIDVLEKNCTKCDRFYGI